ncbi:MAG: hypothetical protein ACTSU3_07220, partial [Candidatus Thorarchaeota archaeon]
IFMGATVWLNDDLLSYTSFALIPPLEDQYIIPEFDSNWTLSNSATEDADRQAILDADVSGIWDWEIECRYAFIVFDEIGTRTSIRINFNTTITTLL